MVRVAINGFGRIGRMVLRAAYEHGFGDVEIVAVNDLTDTATLANLLKYDSVHRRFKGDIGFDKENIYVNGKPIKVFAQKDPLTLPWRDMNIDIVLECTGFFTKRADAAKHLQAGAKKVLISAPSKDADIDIVIGVNEHMYDRNKHHVVSNASCTTNCLAPVVKVLNDNYGIERGFMTTVHAITGDQNMVDGPHKDLRRARAGAFNITPTTTGAASAVARVIPELHGKLDGLAMRVPVPDGSITDFVAILKRDVTPEEINLLFKNVAGFHLKGILEYTEDQIVSSDIIGNPHSSIFDASCTKVMGGNMVKVVAWYDNEWGYSCRMVDVMRRMMQ